MDVNLYEVIGQMTIENLKLRKHIQKLLERVKELETCDTAAEQNTTQEASTVKEPQAIP